MLMAHGILVLVIDGGRMQLLRNRGTEAKPQLELIASDEQRNPATHVLGEASPGRSFESSTSARHAYAEDDLHERREREFADAAFDLLSNKVAPDAEVVLIAPPRLLGHLRKAAPESVRRRVVASFDKDLTQHRPDEICHFLVNHK